MSSGPNDNHLDEADVRTLRAVMDALIPPSEDGVFPGAGELGFAADLPRAAPELIPVVRQILASLGDLLAAQNIGAFEDLDPEGGYALLEEFLSTEPALLPALFFHITTSYYQHPHVLEALDLEPRPPYPVGHEIEAGDASLLDPVRNRGPVYRDPS